VRPGGERDDARLARFPGARGEGAVQSAAQGEVAKVVGGELPFQPSAVRDRAGVMTPALLISRCSGPFQVWTKLATAA